MTHSHHEHLLPGGTLFSHAELAAEFDPGASRSANAHEIVGDFYHRLLAELSKIVEHQWQHNVRRGMVKGFFLSGPPGVGKTTLAKRLGYELGLRFPRERGTDGVATVLLDGSEIARAKYGESERRIREIFSAAQSGLGTPGQRTVLIFDDIESVLMARGSSYAKEWHFSQDSVFFHAIDDLDTSRTTVVLTSNRSDLVDSAIRDRFLEYEVPYPDVETLVGLVRERADDLQLTAHATTDLLSAIRLAAAADSVRSLRDAQHFVFQRYITQLLGTESLALGFR
ncbi:ATP-binding protein [Jatrophihabitans sp. DSM 45814]